MLIYKLLFTETSLFLPVLGSADLKKKKKYTTQLNIIFL